MIPFFLRTVYVLSPAVAFTYQMVLAEVLGTESFMVALRCVLFLHENIVACAVLIDAEIILMCFSVFIIYISYRNYRA